MKKIIVFLLLIAASFACKKEVSPNKVISQLPDIYGKANDFKGLNIDLTYKNLSNSPLFYQSNAVRVLDYIYKNRKFDATSYEVSEGNISYINWNKDKEILFVNFGSDQMCYAGYYVFYGATLEKLTVIAQEKMSLNNDSFLSFYEAKLVREKDIKKEKEAIANFLNTNSCKP
ncbi:MAG: hypothetical protein ACI9V1_002701 [Spirosomataceae bacterium]|jgi:hypothetical protein